MATPRETAPLPEEALLPRDVYALLASANLLRIRGHWEEAVEKCMAAMRLDPQSSSAQSLLGDIYENQGRLDDAVQWYHMALDIHPDSPADRLKLNRALESQQRTAVHPTPPAPGDTAPRRSLPRFTQADFDRLRRLAVTVAALLVVGVIVFALAASSHSLSALGLGTDTAIKTAPIVLATTPPPDPDAGLPRDPAEQTLLDSLHADATLTAQGITVEDVVWDPRASRMTVTLACPLPVPTRALLLQNAMRALQSTAQHSDPATANLLTVRCLLLSGSVASLAFTGDIPRSSVLVPGTDPAALPPDQLQSSFSNVWWSPQMAQ